MSSRDGIGRLAHVSQRQRRRRASDAPVLAADLPARAGLLADLCAEALDLVDDEALHALDRVLVFEAKVERLEGTG